VSEIRIDYPVTISKANRIKQLSEDVGKISKKITYLREDTESYWNGEAASAYRNQCENLENYLHKLDDKMDALADAIIKIANLIKEADEASASAASNISDGI